MKLNDPVSKIPLIGPKYRELLSSLGILTINDLLFYFPRNYFDSSIRHRITDLNREEKLAFVATVLKIKSIRIRGRRMTIQTATVEDESAQIDLVWFNQPFLKKSLKAGNQYIFSGKLNPKSYKPQVQSPDYEELKEKQTHVGLITPIYPLTAGLSNKWLRSRVQWLTDKLEYIEDLRETLPENIIDEYKLISHKQALESIHFPENEGILQKAKNRLAFEELLAIQRKILKRRRAIAKYHGPRIKPARELLDKFIKSLPFSLTKDQEGAIQEILTDFEDEHPMNRLLSGDVGSGKTIIAIAASLLVVNSGHQVVIMVPTTVLADQHYKTFSEILQDFNIKVQLVSSNSKGNEIDPGTDKADIIIGTHAVLYQKYEHLDKLGLIIIDEQHRFGVEQRSELRKSFTDKTKKISPHFLSMTATPIPRTLALTLFGDLEVSQLKNKPKERKIVKTHLVPEEKRGDALKWIAEKIGEGLQVFWIAPLIEESEEIEEIKSVKQVYKNLQENLPKQKMEILHGKIKPAQKKQILSDFQDFADKKINILVSTSVIEVGIDIPNANIIVIEGAERFGLAQLHQLRGRVGRSDAQAWCFLFTSTKPTPEQKARLKYFTEVNDGFKLAEYDLHRRGPGEVYGTKQSGIPNLKIANIFDLELVQKTKKVAIELDK